MQQISPTTKGKDERIKGISDILYCVFVNTLKMFNDVILSASLEFTGKTRDDHATEKN